jgi:hypothetical protein
MPSAVVVFTNQKLIFTRGGRAKYYNLKNNFFLPSKPFYSLTFAQFVFTVRQISATILN